ncbi:MAG: DUF817 domain-containing protein [Pseudomonadota bacterium]
MKHEKAIDNWLAQRLPTAITAFTMFVIKQGWACLFGGSLLLAVIMTKLIWQDHWLLARYDALALIAIGLQIHFLWMRLESWNEAKVIALFHATGTLMEIFKVSVGSWSYPEPGLFKLYDVPLFSGFMYAAVGSYMARVIRLFDMTFAPFPLMIWHFGLAIAIYLNFFMHHYFWDARHLLFLGTLLLYARTRIYFRIGARWYWMPLPLAAFLSSLVLWIAENIGTFTGTWVYAGQSALELVRIDKIESWYLLLFVAFATVTLIKRDVLKQSPVAPIQPEPAHLSPVMRTR